MSDGPADPIGGLTAAAVAMHELFLSYVQAGFSREESLEIVIRLLSARMRNPESGQS